LSIYGNQEYGMNLDEVSSHDKKEFDKNLKSECDSPIPYIHGVSYLESLNMDEPRKHEAFVACNIHDHIEEPTHMDMDEDDPQPSPYKHNDPQPSSSFPIFELFSFLTFDQK